MENVKKKQTVLSLVQSSGVPTLGNYLGAFKNWAKMADEYEDCFFGVADLHAITVRFEPAEFKRLTVEAFALLLALGIDPEKHTVFIQSQVPEHAQLAWILNCYTQYGEASRMTQFKEKAQSHADNINVGLFTYPSLMAADILLYQANYVPVGDDQKQHLELCRNIAERFNGIYGETFTMPEPFITKAGARIMSLTEPEKKMSKSDPNPRSFVSLLDEPNVIIKKIKSAVTDSETRVYYDKNKAGINNLMSIYSCCTGLDYKAIEKEFEGKGYGDFKLAVAEAVAAELRPVQEEYKRLLGDKKYVMENAARGAEKASARASRTLNKVMKKIGFVQL